MKAVRFHTHGGPEVLVYEDVPKVKAGHGEALVRIHAASVNRIDLIVRSGYPGVEIKLPHIPGADLAGIVEELGPGARGVSIGDRVIACPVYGCGECRYCYMGLENMCSRWRMIGFHVDGSYSEYICVPARSLVKIPDGLDFIEASALPLALLTSWHALVSLAGVKRGDTVLVWAGGSGIGSFSIQIAKAYGARVIATAGSQWKVERLKRLGVDVALNHYEDDVVARVRELGGADIVVEHIGASTINRSIDACKPGGRIILFGAITGDEARIPLRRIYLKHLKIIGMHTGSKWELIDALRLVEDGLVKPLIDRVFELRDASSAHRWMEEGRHFGKIVLRIG